jgi:hypothetical protein
LSAKDGADLYSKLEFRKETDNHFRQLLNKEVLAQINHGPKLTEGECEELYNKLGTFDDEGVRKLFRKKILADFGKGPEMTYQDEELIHKWRGDNWLLENPHQ